MKGAGESLGKHLAIAFILALLFYVAAFSWLEHRRVVKGPWEIDFTADATGQPSLHIAQRTLDLSAKLFFPDVNAGRTNFSEWVQFNALNTNLPFGQLLFQDPLYLPGNVTMQLGGHLIEIMPRTLRIDQIERPWQAGAVIILQKNPAEIPAARAPKS